NEGNQNRNLVPVTSGNRNEGNQNEIYQPASAGIPNLIKQKPGRSPVGKKSVIGPSGENSCMIFGGKTHALTNKKRL
ncbi:hypothetical protein, partial [Falsibacillus albus]